MALAAAAMWWWRGRADPPIAPAGGAAMTVALPIRPLKQGDPRWRGLRLGNSAMAGSGCTVACVCMALDALGMPADPPALIARLAGDGGLTTDGLIVWAAVERAFGVRVDLAPPSHPAIDAALGAGVPVLAKIRLHGDGPVHWVLIAGKRGDVYLVSDPLAGDGVALASFGSAILATRIITRR